MSATLESVQNGEIKLHSLFFILPFFNAYMSHNQVRVFLQDDTKTAVVASALGACFFVGGFRDVV